MKQIVILFTLFLGLFILESCAVKRFQTLYSNRLSTESNNFPAGGYYILNPHYDLTLVFFRDNTVFITDSFKYSDKQLNSFIEDYRMDKYKWGFYSKLNNVIKVYYLSNYVDRPKHITDSIELKSVCDNKILNLEVKYLTAAIPCGSIKSKRLKQEKLKNNSKSKTVFDSLHSISESEISCQDSIYEDHFEMIDFNERIDSTNYWMRKK